MQILHLHGADQQRDEQLPGRLPVVQSMHAPPSQVQIEPRRGPPHLLQHKVSHAVFVLRVHHSQCVSAGAADVELGKNIVPARYIVRVVQNNWQLYKSDQGRGRQLEGLISVRAQPHVDHIQDERVQQLLILADPCLQHHIHIHTDCGQFCAEHLFGQETCRAQGKAYRAD